MRAPVCALVVAVGLAAMDLAAMALAAPPAFAQADRTAAAFWKTVQATCDATAAKPPGELGKRIAQTAIDEFTRFGGHRIDANGRLFHFGLTEAEHEEDDGGERQASVGHLGWWQVMKYWRSLYDNDPTDKLEVRGYHDASAVTQEMQTAALLRTSAARLLRLADVASDPAEREMLREAALRAAIIDTLVVGGLRQLRDPAVGRRRRTRSSSPTRIASTSTTRSRRARPSRPSKPATGSIARARLPQRNLARAICSANSASPRWPTSATRRCASASGWSSPAAPTRARSGAPIARWWRMSMRGRARCTPSAATSISRSPRGS